MPAVKGSFMAELATVVESLDDIRRPSSHSEAMGIRSLVHNVLEKLMTWLLSKDVIGKPELDAHVVMLLTLIQPPSGCPRGCKS